MTEQPWLRVRRWRDHQHYTDRNPPWIKWKVDTLEDDELNTKRTETRLFWSLLLLVAAKRENVIPRDAAWLAREVSMPKRAVTRSLNELIQAGFLEGFDSKAACIAADKVAREDASPSRDARTETETEVLSQVEVVVRPLTSDPDSDLTESDEEHKDDEPFAIGPEPALPRNGATADEWGLQPIDPNELRDRWKAHG